MRHKILESDGTDREQRSAGQQPYFTYISFIQIGALRSHMCSALAAVCDRVGGYVHNGNGRASSARGLCAVRVCGVRSARARIYQLMDIRG